MTENANESMLDKLLKEREQVKNRELKNGIVSKNFRHQKMVKALCGIGMTFKV